MFMENDNKSNQGSQVGASFIANWVRNGLLWGGMMYIVMTFVFPYIEGNEIPVKRMLINIPVWLFAGVGYGYAMKRYYLWAQKR